MKQHLTDEEICTAWIEHLELCRKYNALRDAGNDLAESLQRALGDIEDWGCKTKQERRVLRRWKKLIEGGGEHGCNERESRTGQVDGAKTADRPALDCTRCHGDVYVDDDRGMKSVCSRCKGTGKEPKE